jgi:phosphate transport system substrate-binding protein
MKVLSILLIFSLVIFSCSDPSETEKQSEVKDSIEVLTVYTDESFYPIVLAESKVFNTLNKKFRVSISVVPQETGISWLLSGKITCMVTGRPLVEAEKDSILAQQLSPKESPFAMDALAFIMPGNSTDSIVTEAELRDRFLSGYYSLLFDTSGSADLYTFQQWLGKKSLKNAYSAGNHEKLFKAIKEPSEGHPLMVTGSCWISDKDDPKVAARRSSGLILSLKTKDAAGKPYIAYPLHSEIADKSYPFVRTLILINLGGTGKAGTAFAAFMRSEEGQKIVLKEGLLPVSMPGREINLVY